MRCHCPLLCQDHTFFPPKESIKSQTKNSLRLTGNIGIAKSCSAHTTSPFSAPSYNPALCKTNESSDWKGPDENNTHALTLERSNRNLGCKRSISAFVTLHKPWHTKTNPPPPTRHWHKAEQVRQGTGKTVQMLWGYPCHEWILVLPIHTCSLASVGWKRGQSFMV